MSKLVFKRMFSVLATFVLSVTSSNIAVRSSYYCDKLQFEGFDLGNSYDLRLGNYNYIIPSYYETDINEPDSFRAYAETSEKYDRSELNFGDINSDGIINAVDASGILVLYASINSGEIELTEDDISHCDINGDKLINAVDASSILRYYAYISGGYSTTLPEFMSDSFVPETTTTTTTTYLPDNVPGTIPFDINSIPKYSGESYVVVNNNIPYFDPDDYEPKAFEYYSPLDLLERCSICMACISEEIMPTEERGAIGSIKPTGWHTVRYDDIIADKYLYNRCHLIGYQLTAENANVLNLITGTRYLNIEGMLPFENKTANYISSTHNHVLYRSTPVFVGEELVCRGVLMEGYSLEDNGKGICFNVFCYNVQPGIVINYADGESSASGTTTTSTTTVTTTTKVTTASTTTTAKPATTTTRTTTTITTTKQAGGVTYIVNLNPKSQKFHRPDCASVKRMNESNKWYFTGTREELIKLGYEPCEKCNP